MSHPILEATAVMRATLKSVADVNPTFMATDAKSQALIELARAGAQLAELRLRVLSAAEDVAADSGARDAAGWLARHIRIRGEEARAALTLATSLDRQTAVLATGMREGEVNPAQARVIARALTRLRELPEALDPEILVRAEEKLVAYARDFGPTELARLGCHILAVVAPDVADEAEARRLAELETAAKEQIRLRLRRQGDGTTRISGRLPDAAATRLATYLEAFANPRKHGAPEHAGEDAPCQDPVARLPYPRRLGEAFCAFLETLDSQRLPLHGGDATTVVVTIDIKTLRAQLGSAGLLGAGHIPGDPDGDGSGDLITAAEARRLACTAKIIPAVLDGDSIPLDLGRAQRLFTPAQRKALLRRDKTCRAAGCDIPGTWAEAHHLVAWSAGGKTDLANGILLCSHHHHRIHDDRYFHNRLPDGDVRFSRRR